MLLRKKLLVAFAITAASAAAWSIWVDACDQGKHTSAQAVSRAGARTTAAFAASGKGDCGASAAAAAQCTAHGAATASSSCQGHGADAATASNGGAHECRGASAASLEACNQKMGGAGMMGAPSCPEHASGANVTASMREPCDACADMIACTNELRSNGVQTQVLPLKNGVMFVFTTDTPARVRAVQNALARHNDRLIALASSGDRARLCPECKSVRGALASGKMTRETQNMEGGVFTLVTSPDPAIVSKLRAMATALGNTRNKI